MIQITAYPNHEGGIRYLMQETDSRRVLKQGELRAETGLSETGIAAEFPELSAGDRSALAIVFIRVVETWHPATFKPGAGSAP